jgi:hypothetical protein
MHCGQPRAFDRFWCNVVYRTYRGKLFDAQ